MSFIEQKSDTQTGVGFFLGSLVSLIYFAKVKTYSVKYVKSIFF